MDLREDDGEYRTWLTALEKVEFCLRILKEGPELDWSMRIGPRLVLQEVIGALLHARDELQAYDSLQTKIEED